MGILENEPNVVCFGFIWFVLLNVSPLFPHLFPHRGTINLKMILK